MQNSYAIMSVKTEAIDLPMDISLLDITPTAGLHDFDDTCDGDYNGISDKRIYDSTADALVKCIREIGSVDMKRISGAAGVTLDEAENALRGAVYRDPDKWDGSSAGGWVTADEYLSGNLRNKLIKARIANKLNKDMFEENIRALEALMPPEIAADDIYVTLGSPWLPADIIDDFVNYIIQPHGYHMCRGTIHDEETGSWEIPDKGKYWSYVRNNTTYGTKRIDAVHIIEKTLNMKTIRITDEVRSDTTKSGYKRVVNREETAAAHEKQRLIINEFRRWIWRDEGRSQRLIRLFGNRYACTVVRRFDGRFLEFPGMSDTVELYPYQKNAVARILFTPNTLLAHDVGAGKTYVMAAAAMELRRLGMAKKCMFVVPNNLVEQWRSMFISIYPHADIVCVEPKDMDMDNKNRTLRRLRDKNFDGIIIAYSCFDRIPLSRRSYVKALKAEKEELLKAKRKKKNVTSRLRKRIDKISEELSKLSLAGNDSDDLICFDKLGIDRLFIDEAHNYKNVSIDTAIYGVFGINRKGSAKCDSLLDKVRYIQRTHEGGGVVMATGTPITNSISDIYVFQQYLQSGELELLGLQTFDSWIGMFAEKTTEFEIAVDTNSYRLATRFSKFHNIPELTTILSSIADFHMIDKGEGIPELNGYTDVKIPRSTALKTYLEDISRRADKVHNGKVNRSEDNMLSITGDGRKAALDIRLVSANVSGSMSSSLYDQSVGICKASECAERAALTWHATRDEKLTQLIFCDTSTPKAGFNMYDEMRRRLIDLGVDDREIAYIHDAATETKRKKLFREVRAGRVRILIGSTFKLGLGVNVQDRLIAIHHLDLPWRPADMVQREGRILRSGNINKEVRIYRYITEGSFDAYSWQLLETKQRFISNILSGTIKGRSGAEVDDTVLDYAEVKALALGNPLLKSRVETSNELTKMTILRRKNIEDRVRLEQRYYKLPDEIEAKEHELETCKADAEYVAEQGRELYKSLSASERKQMAGWRKYIRGTLAAVLCSHVMEEKDMPLLDYRGFTISCPAAMDADHPYLKLIREGIYRVDMSDKETGILVRIDNYIDKLGDRAQVLEMQLSVLRQELAETEAELAKDEGYLEKIDDLNVRLEEIDEKLGVKDTLK